MLTRWQCAALGYVAGALLATVACLAAIAHETITSKRRTAAASSGPPPAAG